MTGRSVSFNYKLNHAQEATESTAYFVLEHQPHECDQLPPNGIVTWSNISVEVNHARVRAPRFRAMQESLIDHCTCTKESGHLRQPNYCPIREE